MTDLIEQTVAAIEDRIRKPLALWSLRGRIVLYIEDVQSDIDTVTNELGKYSVNVIAGHGKRLRKIVRKQDVDFVIVDHKLPGVPSGFQTLHEIREDVGSEVPVVCFSVHISNVVECRTIASQYGEKVHDFVRKPLQNGNLVNAICGIVWDPVRDEFRRSVREGLSVASPSIGQLREISRAEGQVVSIAKDICVVRFHSGADEVMLEFPSWRLMRAGADNLNCKVEHIVLEGGTQVISDLKNIGEPAQRQFAADELVPLPEDVELELRRAEKEDNES